MDFRAVIDLVKYTLALSAGCFVYALEKLVPTPPQSRWYVLALLLSFVISATAGVFIFSAATAAQHSNPGRAERQKKRIRWAAYVHIGFLAVGVLVLGSKLVERVFTEVPVSGASSSPQVQESLTRR